MSFTYNSTKLQYVIMLTFSKCFVSSISSDKPICAWNVIYLIYRTNCEMYLILNSISSNSLNISNDNRHRGTQRIGNGRRYKALKEIREISFRTFDFIFRVYVCLCVSEGYAYISTENVLFLQPSFSLSVSRSLSRILLSS